MRATVLLALVGLPLLGAAPATAQTAPIMDAEFNAQWGLAAIGAQYALEKGITGAGVAVGVVDGIFQTTHPEFDGRINAFEYNPQSLAPDAHGTHVAGIIGAGRNGFGMEGVAPDVSLAPIWAFADNDDLAVAYRDAVAAGIKVFNNSWGLTTERDITTQTRQDAISTVGIPLIEALHSTLQSGAVQVWAAGNAGLANPDLYAGLPYLFPQLQSGWIVVTAVDRNLQFAGFNKCGVTANFCISAPGVDIYSTVPTSTYGTMSGTSMAAPHVTGAVALAKQMFPNASGAELASLVLRTATDIGDPGIDATFGWGFLSVENLVNVIDPGNDPEDGDDNGALFVNAAYARFAAVDTLISTLWDRSANRLMRHAGTAPAISVAQAMAPQSVPPMALGGPMQAEPEAVVVSTGRSAAVWGQGLAAHASLAGSPRSSADLGGAIGGYDLFGNDTLSGGVAIAYTYSSLDTHDAGDGSARGWHAYAYATWQQDNWFIDGIVGGNWFDNSYTRTAIGGTAGTVLGNQGIAGYSSNDTQGVSGRLSAGHLYAFRDWAFLPYAFVSLIHQRTGGGAETGADIFSLDVSSSRFEQVEGGAGARAQLYRYAFQGYTIAPTVDLAYGRVGGDTSLPVGFDLLGTQFQSNTDVGRNVLHVGAQLDVMRFDEMVGGFLAYDGRFQERAENNTFSGGLIVRF